MWRGDLQIAYWSFIVLKGKTFYAQGEAEAVPKRTVSAAPVQANYLIRILYLDNH